MDEGGIVDFGADVLVVDVVDDLEFFVVDGMICNNLFFRVVTERGVVFNILEYGDVTMEYVSERVDNSVIEHGAVVILVLEEHVNHVGFVFKKTVEVVQYL